MVFLLPMAAKASGFDVCRNQSIGAAAIAKPGEVPAVAVLISLTVLDHDIHAYLENLLTLKEIGKPIKIMWTNKP